MKDFSPSAVWVIAVELFGTGVWILLALAAAVAVAFVVALVRQRGFRGPAARVALWSGAIAGLVAVIAAPMASQARFANLNGALDWALLAAAGLSAMVALTVLLFAILGATRPAQA